jgi:predicted nucleotidyltransferase
MPTKQEKVMRKEEALNLLREHFAETQRQFGVKRLALFGSTVRDEARDDSDVDVLVEFDGKPDSKRYFGLMFYLEDLLGCTLDLVTDKALRPELRPYVEKEMIYV